jgi:DnaJ-class molecular chaperone
MTTTQTPCPTPGVYYSGVHLAHMPLSQTQGVSYCPTCLGFGTIATTCATCGDDDHSTAEHTAPLDQIPNDIKGW